MAYHEDIQCGPTPPPSSCSASTCSTNDGATISTSQSTVVEDLENVFKRVESIQIHCDELIEEKHFLEAQVVIANARINKFDHRVCELEAQVDARVCELEAQVDGHSQAIDHLMDKLVVTTEERDALKIDLAKECLAKERLQRDYAKMEEMNNKNDEQEKAKNHESDKQKIERLERLVARFIPAELQQLLLDADKTGS